MTDSLKALIEACRNGEANYQDLVDRVLKAMNRRGVTPLVTL